MKKTIVLLLAVILCGGLGYMVSHIIRAKKQAVIDNEKKQQLPDFTFFDLNGIKKGNSFIKSGAPVVIIYFNSDCEHCQQEATQLNANISLFKDTQIVMVSFNKAEEIKKFSKTYGLDKYDQITFMMDKEYKFTHWFGSCSIPAVFVYNADHHLVKEFYGEVKIEAIKKLI